MTKPYPPIKFDGFSRAYRVR